MRIPFNFISNVLLSGQINSDDITISFLDYVKSQLHYNVLAQFKNRDLKLYLKSLHYLEGNGNGFEEYSQVLRFFYEDVADFLIIRIKNESKEIKINLIIEDPFDRLSKFPVELSDIQQKLSNILNGEETDDMLIAGVLYKFTLPEMGSLKSTRQLALASLLYETSKGDTVVKISPDWR